MAKANIFVKLDDKQKNDFDVNILKSRQNGEDINKSKFIRDCINKFNSNPDNFLKFLKYK